jgi:parallel beta-helix repeat protein
MAGIKIGHITCSNWGGTGIATRQAACIRTTSNARAQTISVAILNSTFIGNRFSSLRLSYSKNTVIEGNTITNQKCGLTNQGSLHWAGIKIGGDSTGMTIRNNRIDSFESYSDCLIDVTPTNTKLMIMAGFYCDTGGNNGVIEKNVIHTLNYPNVFSTGDSVGIFLESRCSGWTVKDNIVHKIGHKGIRNGSSGTGDPNNNTLLNNTFANIGLRGIWVRRGANQTIKNNIVHVNPSGVPIEFHATAVAQGGHQVDYNLYWDMQDGSRVGQWGDTLTRNLASWRQSCQCDGGALSANPSFINVSAGSEDFRLTSSSPARGAGERAIDLGASLSP